MIKKLTFLFLFLFHFSDAKRSQLTSSVLPQTLTTNANQPQSAAKVTVTTVWFKLDALLCQSTKKKRLMMGLFFSSLPLFFVSRSRIKWKCVFYPFLYSPSNFLIYIVWTFYILVILFWQSSYSPLQCERVCSMCLVCDQGWRMHFSAILPKVFVIIRLNLFLFCIDLHIHGTLFLCPGLTKTFTFNYRLPCLLLCSNHGVIGIVSCLPLHNTFVFSHVLFFLQGWGGWEIWFSVSFL